MPVLKKGFTLVEIMIVVMIIGILAMLAMPVMAKARRDTRSKACINNLRLIAGAKDQYAMDNNIPDGSTATPSITVLRPYLRGNSTPSCPAGGTYNARNYSTSPTCNLGNINNNYHARR